MSYVKEDLDDLYKIFGQIEKLREALKNDPVHDAMLGVLDEVIKLRAEVEKLKTQTRG